MNPTASPRHPFKAIVAIAAMAVAVHGVRADAGTSEVDVPDVDVVGELPLQAACPDADIADLADDLAPAWADAHAPSTVAVHFKVQGRHVYHVVPDTSSRRTFHQLRRAVHGLSCDTGDDEVHDVRLVVRFVGDDAGSRVARAVVVDDPDER